MMLPHMSVDVVGVLGVVVTVRAFVLWWNAALMPIVSDHICLLCVAVVTTRTVVTFAYGVYLTA